MTQRIIIAGAGGQGVMLLGKVLAEAAMRENKFVTWIPSYGAEVRGGTAHCMVIISDKEISSPYVEKADTVIIMNGPSLERFRGRIADRGLLIINNSLAEQRLNKENYIAFPFTDIAHKLGNIKVANMVALGSLIAARKTVRAKTVIDVMQDIAPAGRKNLVEINKKALYKGIELADKNDKS